MHPAAPEQRVQAQARAHLSMSFRTSSRFTSSVRIEGTAERRSSLPARALIQLDEAPTELDIELDESVDLYYRRPPRSLAYRHFESARSALIFARDSLSADQVRGSVLQVGERRFEGEQVALMVRRLGSRSVAKSPVHADA
jgi:hypothetical protein